MANLTRIRELFEKALDLDRAERSAFLDEACGGDPSLRTEVEALLDSFEKNPDFLSRPAWASCIESNAEGDRPLEDLEPEAELPFERLGEYRLIRRLGEGGMGVVYLAVQEPLNRLVALKVIRPERIGAFEAEARFRREVQSISELKHANIVTVFGSGEEKGVHYFAMEFVPGEGLDQFLRRVREEGGAIPQDQLLGWIAHIAGALDSAHRAGIIHRDVKPSNIRVTPEGHAMLLDFGVARNSDLASLTLSGEFRGTPNYASPEQVTAKRTSIDGRSDIYSLGVTLYEAITGRVPFEGETTQQVFYQIIEAEPEPPRRIDPAISRELETVILKAMAKNPAGRYETATDFADDLARLIARRPVKARPAGWLTRSTRWIRRHRFGSLSAAAALLILIAASVVHVILSAQQEKELRRVEAEFVPIREALRWPDFVTRTQAWGWIVDVDPEAPGGHFLQAIYNIGFMVDALDEAAAGLDRCIALCPRRAERALEEDARYLLGLVKCHLASESADGAQRDLLLEEAHSEFLQIGPFDPLSAECFLWRDGEWSDYLSGAVRPDLKKIRINGQHSLVHLFQGSAILCELFRGGTKRDFEEVFKHLGEVLESRPKNVAALIFMGRANFFFARFFNFLELTDDALKYLDLAAETASDPTNLWIVTSKAQTLLLRGDNDGALHILKNEIDEDWYAYHNIPGTLGKIHARKRLYDEALNFYSKALLSGTLNDFHVQAAKAELHIYRREPDLALESVQHALLKLGKNSQIPTSVYSVVAAIHLQQDDYRTALDFLELSWNLGVHSPRDLSLSVMLLATFPDEEKRRALGLANYMIRKAEDNSDLKGRLSPTCLSGIGAEQLLRRRYGSAVDYLEKAIDGRKVWPRVAREYYWSENARDRYFLAIAHGRLAREVEDGAVHEQKARSHYEMAEADFETRIPAIETALLLERVRAMARAVLAIDGGADPK